jgi:hypothetical protein
MAYVPGTNKPILLVPSIGEGPALWYYAHPTDPHTDVDAPGYFSDGAAYGLKANDVMIVVDIDTATCTMHRVSSATTIGAATLT